MKSAYELALARLEKASGETKKLSDDEKAQLAEIDRKYESKIAECKLGFSQQAQAATEQMQLNVLQSQMADELRVINSEWEAEKDAIWGTD